MQKPSMQPDYFKPHIPKVASHCLIWAKEEAEPYLKREDNRNPAMPLLWAIAEERGRPTNLALQH